MKLTQGNSDLAYLLESVEGGENLARFSLIGSRPFKTLKTGPEETLKGDPLIHLENEMKNYDCIEFPKLKLPPFIGGAVGYVGYDCVRYFEPSTEKFVKAQKAKMKIPESMFMLCDTIVVFDHVRHSLKIVSHCRLDGEDLNASYESATKRLDDVVCVSFFLNSLRSKFTTHIQILLQVNRLSAPISFAPSKSSRKRKNEDEELDVESLSNVGQSGYEGFVRSLKTNITNGDIIQAVPSQRIAIPMQDNPFNLYRRLRTINPSPYMFFLRLGDGNYVAGASPEMLCKFERETRVVTTHPIAGTRRRGKDEAEDSELAKELLGDEKERAEHIMLVDLGRNDIGRVAVCIFVCVCSFSHYISLTVSTQHKHTNRYLDLFKSQN
jgi:anthranilate synthase component I